MKKNIIYLVLLVVLGAAALYFMGKGSKISETRIDRRDFSVSEIEKVDKIIMSSKTPTTVTLEKAKNGEWQVGGKKVRVENINLLLKTMERMEIKNPLSKKMEQNVLNKMATASTKVEVFKEGKLVKTFYVGHNTPDNLGTFMMLKGATKPYAVHLPGHNGYLSTRFYTNAYQWRDRQLFNIDNLDITSVHLKYSQGKAMDFHIQKTGNGYTMKDHLDQPMNFDPVKLNEYLASFRGRKHEGYLMPSDPMNGEKLEEQIPFFDLSITTASGEAFELRGYYKMVEMEDESGNNFVEPDKERMFARFDGEYVIIQYYAFQKILKSNTDFK